MVKTDQLKEWLYRAIKGDRLDILQMILARGEVSDIQFYCYCGDTPLGLAVAEGREDLLPSLLPKADKCFALHTAVQLKQERVVKYLRSNYPYKQKFLSFLGLH
jgi:hypothetical protein